MQQTETAPLCGNQNPPQKTKKPDWFNVPGDLDDFLFYYEEKNPCSER